ncbi:MAG: hypothetical protein KAX19_02810, partial [Candidatus Brocadiae bacterium]|nr:hypothetical protein [Candidatus Brocadiia bacterium]
RQSMEAYLSDKAESMLSMVLGPGRCEVRVSAELDFEDTKETKRTYDPDKKVVTSEKIETTKTTGTAATVGGVVGAAGNVPGQGQAGPVGAAGPSQESTTENTDIEYLVSESVMETVNRGASIKRLTVAAFIDPSSLQGEEGGSPPAMEDISRIIKDAIGIDESRGDSLKIVDAAFHPVTAELADVTGNGPAWLVPAGRYFAIAALGLVLLFVARRVLKNIESATPRRVVVPEIMGPEGQGGPPARVDQDELIRREISKFVESNPEAAGRVLEGWVMGEE